MVRGVNARTGARRAEQVAATEQRLVTSATTLFLRDGYVGTTLSAVSAHAGLAPRTLYLRFPTKGDLFRRVMDAAVAGGGALVGAFGAGVGGREEVGPPGPQRGGKLVDRGR